MRPSVILEQHREDVRRVVAKYRGENPRVFGSVARGTDRDDSDIDILIDPLPGMTLMDQGAMVSGLEDILHVNVDIVTSDTPPPDRLMLIVREAKCI